MKYLLHIEHDAKPMTAHTARNIIKVTARTQMEIAIAKILERVDANGEAAVRIVIKQERE